MEADPIIMREVFISLKRLLSKYGKELQQLTWHCVMQLLNKAADLLNNVRPKTFLHFNLLIVFPIFFVKFI